MVRNTNCRMGAIIAVVMMAFAEFAFAGDVSYLASRSNYTDSQRFKLGYRFNPDHKIALALARSEARLVLEDPSSSSVKLSYRYGKTGKFNFATDLKSSDESYFFTGKSLALKTRLSFGEASHLSLATGFGIKTYSKASSESLSQQDFSLSFEHELSDLVNFGVDGTISQFVSASSQTQQALSDQTVATTDINDYTGILSKDSVSLYFEYALEDWNFAISAGVDHLLLGSSTNTITDISVDYSAGSWTLSGFYARSKSDFSSTFTDTSGLGLAYGF